MTTLGSAADEQSSHPGKPQTYVVVSFYEVAANNRALLGLAVRVHGVVALGTEIEARGTLYANTEDCAKARVGNAISLRMTDKQVTDAIRKGHKLRGEDVTVVGIVREDIRPRGGPLRLLIDVDAINFIDAPSQQSVK